MNFNRKGGSAEQGYFEISLGIRCVSQRPMFCFQIANEYSNIRDAWATDENPKWVA
jgi:hypothetical protein